MNVAYFYYSVWPAAVAALPAGTARVHTGPQTGDYFAAFTQWWDSGDDLAVIEQDVRVHSGVIPAFFSCPQPWCSFGWEVSPGQPSFWWLGCTKFSAAVQKAVDLGKIRGHPADICPSCTEFTPCHRHLDLVLTAVGEHLGQQHPHIHKPDIVHLRACPLAHCYCQKVACCGRGRHCYEHSSGCHLNCHG